MNVVVVVDDDGFVVIVVKPFRHRYQRSGIVRAQCDQWQLDGGPLINREADTFVCGNRRQWIDH